MTETITRHASFVSLVHKANAYVSQWPNCFAIGYSLLDRKTITPINPSNIEYKKSTIDEVMQFLRAYIGEAKGEVKHCMLIKLPDYTMGDCTWRNLWIIYMQRGSNARATITQRSLGISYDEGYTHPHGGGEFCMESRNKRIIASKLKTHDVSEAVLLAIEVTGTYSRGHGYRETNHAHTCFISGLSRAQATLTNCNLCRRMIRTRYTERCWYCGATRCSEDEVADKCTVRDRESTASLVRAGTINRDTEKCPICFPVANIIKPIEPSTIEPRKFCANESCERASQLLPVSEFRRHSSTLDGYENACKQCRGKK